VHDLPDPLAVGVIVAGSSIAAASALHSVKAVLISKGGLGRADGVRMRPPAAVEAIFKRNCSEYAMAHTAIQLKKNADRDGSAIEIRPRVVAAHASIHSAPWINVWP